jgi:hypothetical protein
MIYIEMSVIGFVEASLALRYSTSYRFLPFINPSTPTVFTGKFNVKLSAHFGSFSIRSAMIPFSVLKSCLGNTSFSDFSLDRTRPWSKCPEVLPQVF